MKTTHTVTREVTQEETKDILCNKCGDSLVPEGSQSSDDFYGLVETIVTGGYFSTHLIDGATYTFSLCEGCLSELFKTFKYPTYQNNHLFPEDNNMLDSYSKEELKKFLAEMEAQDTQTVEDLKMMDQIEETIEIKEKKI